MVTEGRVPHDSLAERALPGGTALLRALTCQAGCRRRISNIRPRQTTEGVTITPLNGSKYRAIELPSDRRGSAPGPGRPRPGVLGDKQQDLPAGPVTAGQAEETRRDYPH